MIYFGCFVLGVWTCEIANDWRAGKPLGLSMFMAALSAAGVAAHMWFVK